MFPEQIKKVREWFIQQTGADMSKKSGVITIEGSNNFKTDKIKTLIKRMDEGINCLPPEAIEHAAEVNNNSSREDNINIRECPLINYSFKHKLKNGTGRGYTLMKNAAILFNTRYDKNKAKELLSKLITIQGTGETTWLEWAQNNEKTDFSCAELRTWIRQTQSCDIEELTCWRCPNGRT